LAEEIYPVRSINETKFIAPTVVIFLIICMCVQFTSNVYGLTSPDHLRNFLNPEMEVCFPETSVESFKEWRYQSPEHNHLKKHALKC